MSFTVANLYVHLIQLTHFYFRVLVQFVSRIYFINYAIFFYTNRLSYHLFALRNVNPVCRKFDYHNIYVLTFLFITIFAVEYAFNYLSADDISGCLTNY